MADISDRAVEALADAIESYVRAYVKEISFDVTKHGVVTEVLGGSRYRVSIDGSEHSVSCCTGQVFSMGDTVIVLLIQNDVNRKYIIGKG